MGDTNTQEFKILITGDASSYAAAGGQASDTTKKLKIDTSDLGDETKKSLGIFDEEAEKLKKLPPPETAEGFKGLNLRGREVREIFGKLNEIIPGLGTALRGLGEVSNEAGAAVAGAEGEVAAANTSMLASSGPLIVIVLAIQAAMTYWDLYSESVKDAAEKQGKALDKIRTATADALKEQVDFTEAMKKASEPEDKYAEALGRTNAIIAATTEAKRKLMKLDEDAELAQAKTPEEKDEIKKRYGDKEDALSSGEEGQKIAALQKTIADLQADQGDATADKKQYTDEEKRIAKLAREAQARGDDQQHDKLLAEVPRMNDKIAADDKRIEGDQTKITKYSSEVGTQSAVHGINDDERRRAENRPISKAVEGIDAHAQGEKLSQEQIKANQQLTQLFASHAGGIQQMTAIIKYHLAHSTTQDQEIEALKTALANLQKKGGQSGFNNK